MGVRRALHERSHHKGSGQATRGATTDGQADARSVASPRLVVEALLDAGPQALAGVALAARRPIAARAALAEEAARVAIP